MDIVLLIITLSISTYLISSMYHRYNNREILPHLIVLCFLWQTIGIIVAYAFYYTSLYSMLNYPHWLNFFFVGILGISISAFLKFLYQNGMTKDMLKKTLMLSGSVFLTLYLVYKSYLPIRSVLFFNIFIYTVSLCIMFIKRDRRQSALSFAQMSAGIITFSISIALKDIFTEEYVIGIANGSIFIIAMGAMMYYLEYTTYRMKDFNQSLISEKNTSEDLRKKYEMVLENVQEGIWEYDLAADRVFLSKMLRELFGVNSEYVEGAFAIFMKHIHPDDIVLFVDSFKGVTHEAFVCSMMRNTNNAFVKEYRVFSHIENRYVWIHVNSSRVVDPKTFRIHLYSTISVIQGARDAEERIYQLAYYDQLTGLRNATSFYEHLEEILKNRDEKSVLFLIDIDRFKYINDSRGHSFGNSVIRNIGRNLIPPKQSQCEAFRMGGTEFLLVAPLTHLSEISDHLSSFFGTPMTIDGSSIHLTASIGYCPLDGHTLTGERLMIQLDLAKHKAKEKGGNCQVGYSEAFNEELQEKVMLSDALRSAILKRELFMHYQPKIHLTTGETVGYEALLRWTLNGRNIPPDQIIRVAEETGQIYALGNLIIAMVFQESDFTQENQTIAINLSVMQLEQNGFLEDLAALQKIHGIDSGRFIFEITENVLMEGMEGIVQTLHALQEMGYSISLDDFGTGYASYNYLSQLPIDELKLDKTLTQSVLNSDKDRIIVQHMVEIGKLLDFTVVCEGIENQEEYMIMQSFGCDLGQGYYFSRPLASSQFLKSEKSDPLHIYTG